MHRLSDDEAITLIEVMIALLVLLVVLSAFVATIIAGFQSLSESRARQFASQVATESIENLRTLPQSAIALDTNTVDIAAISNCTVNSLPGFDPDGPGLIDCEEIVSRPGGSITSAAPYAGTQEGVTYVTVPTYTQDGSVPSGTVRVTVESGYSLPGDTATIRRQALFSEVSRG